MSDYENLREEMQYYENEHYNELRKLEAEEETAPTLKADREAWKAKAEKAEAELKEAVADIEELLGQEDYLGVCWACAKDCKKGDKCVPKWRGARKEGEK